MRPLATMRRQVITVQAGRSYPYKAVGDFIFVESSTGDVFLRAYNQSEGQLVADGVLVRAAVSYKFKQLYDDLTLDNTTGGSDVNLILWTGEGDANLNILSGTISALSGGTFDSSATSTLTAASSLDIAADSTRRELHLQVPSTNTGDLDVRDNAGTTSEGMAMNPATGLLFYVISCSGAVRIRNNTASSQDIRRAEVKA